MADETLGTQEHDEDGEEVDVGVLVEVAGSAGELVLALEKSLLTKVGGIAEQQLCSDTGLDASFIRHFLRHACMFYRSVEVEVWSESNNTQVALDWTDPASLKLLDKMTGDIMYKPNFYFLDGAIIPLTNGSSFDEKEKEIKIEWREREVPVEVVKEVPTPFPVTVGAGKKTSGKPKKIAASARKPRQTAKDKAALIQWNAYPPTPQAKAEFVEPPWYQEMVEALEDGSHVALVGSYGIGKSTAVKQVAHEFGSPLAIIGGSAGVRDKDLLGRPFVIEATTHFRPADFACIVVHGGMAMITEASAIDPDAVQILNGIVEEPFSIQLAGHHYPTHDKFRLVIDLNNNVRGNKALPQSTSDRFHLIQVPWPDENFLKAILYSQGCKDESVAEKYWKFAAGMWDAYDNMRISYALSPRRLFQAVRLNNRGTEFEEALTKAVLPFVEVRAELDTVKKLIADTAASMKVKE